MGKKMVAPRGRKPSAKVLLGAPMVMPPDVSQSGMGALQGASPPPSGLGYKKGGKVKAAVGGAQSTPKKPNDSTGKFKKGGMVDADDGGGNITAAKKPNDSTGKFKKGGAVFGANSNMDEVDPTVKATIKDAKRKGSGNTMKKGGPVKKYRAGGSIKTNMHGAKTTVGADKLNKKFPGGPAKAKSGSEARPMVRKFAKGGVAMKSGAGGFKAMPSSMQHGRSGGSK